MTERRITELQEKVYRMMAGEFLGLSQAATAKRLKITPRAVRYILSRLKENAPELFPLVTKQEYEVLVLLNQGLTNKGLSMVLDISTTRVSQIKKSLEKKGRWKEMPAPKVLSYNSYMDDGQIARKF